MSTIREELDNLEKKVSGLKEIIDHLGGQLEPMGGEPKIIDPDLLGIMQGYCWACVCEQVLWLRQESPAEPNEVLESIAVTNLKRGLVAAFDHKTGRGLCCEHLNQAIVYIDNCVANRRKEDQHYEKFSLHPGYRSR